ncbi:pre-rRNA-processing protein esf2-like [Sipha flava]|uniref:Activator of basal transcription 1 n=1 Tax=Sipha flava TaxID=143950 RepID=A0A8B8FZM6_9HEMI|nr:pre-rRNA-processing protein esf2-like [Sipha flava]
MSDCDTESLLSVGLPTRTRKKGIVYLSSIPKYMNVTKLRELLGEYAEIGRVFLQPASNPNLKKRPAKHFTEGWVEFERKSAAKKIATLLNGKRIDSRKRSKYFDSVWNIKYLPRFKWIHLNERLAYEKAVRKHRLRAEVSQVKREANHFSSNIVRSEKNKFHQKSNVDINVRQRLPEEEFVQNKNNATEIESRTEFLSKLFN